MHAFYLMRTRTLVSSRQQPSLYDSYCTHTARLLSQKCVTLYKYDTSTHSSSDQKLYNFTEAQILWSLVNWRFRATFACHGHISLSHFVSFWGMFNMWANLEEYVWRELLTRSRAKTNQWPREQINEYIFDWFFTKKKSNIRSVPHRRPRQGETLQHSNQANTERFELTIGRET